MLETSEYEPFGQQVNAVAPAKDGPGYTGHVQDAATGLTYMQQRYYDPTIGKFLSVDPIAAIASTGANFNRYWYANNNPYKFTDHDGRIGRNLVNAGIGGLVGGELEVYRQYEAGNLQFGKIASVKTMASIVVETARGAAIGAATGKAASATEMVLLKKGVGAIANAVVSGTSSAMASGYTTLATGPASDVLKGQEIRPVSSHGDDAAAAMVGSVAGTAAGKVSGHIMESAAPGAGSVVVRSIPRIAEEAASAAASEKQAKDSK